MFEEKLVRERYSRSGDNAKMKAFTLARNEDDLTDNSRTPTGKSFWHYACMKCAPPFSPQGFPLFLVTYPHTVVLETLIDNVKLKSFYRSVLWNYYQYTYSFFDNISDTFCEKTAIHSLVCLLRYLVLTTGSVIVQTSSTIWHFFFFGWMAGRP